MITTIQQINILSTILFGHNVNAFSPSLSYGERNFRLCLQPHVSSNELPSASPSDDSVPNLLSEQVDRSSPSSSPLELWLDLRNTVVSPMTALEHFINDLWDEFPPPSGKDCLIDNVLVSLPTFATIEEQHEFVKHILTGLEEEYESEIKVWFVGPNEVGDESGTDGLISAFRTNLNGEVSETSVGKLLQVNDSKGKNAMYSNPMPALETISNGEWILLDTSSEIDSTTSTKMIQDLVNLVSNVNSMGNLIGSGEIVADESEILNNQGGIAIECHTASNVVEMGGYIQALSFETNSFTSTDSGILIHSFDESDKQDVEGHQKYALVMPFDDALWMAASMVLGGTS